MIIEDKDFDSPEEYEFPYIYKNPCRGLLSRRTIKKVQNNKIDHGPVIYREKRKVGLGKVVFIAESDGKEIKRGTSKEISLLTNMSLSSIAHQLSDVDTFIKGEWRITRLRSSTVFKTAFDGERIYKNVDVSTHEIAHSFVDADYRIKKNALNGDVVLCGNVLYSKDKIITKENFMNYVKNYATDGKRFYFGSVKHLLSLTKEKTHFGSCQNQLSKKGKVALSDLTIYKGGKK
jgi:hypothetical protein